MEADTEEDAVTVEVADEEEEEEDEACEEKDSS